MNNIAVVFPGQGSQKIGMLQDYYQEYKIVREIFQQASDILNFDIWNIIQKDEDKLNKTEYTQPIIVTTSIAIWSILEQYYSITPMLLSGHSVGEYTALIASGSLTFETALKIVNLRGKLMQKAAQDRDTGMSAILGLSDQLVEESCNIAKKNGIVEPCNYNAPGQVVISGEKKSYFRSQ